ncbi:protein CDV3 homolog [Actinia tenebrosa]|uniref:Protein CDV3 homolog n=1 Tax=Actinia tenebrosa TaxID=6105 RepID=A0A6P8HQD0_ACTTE|nr:protein CDV3 homolog [Actinia tenebrosa]
MSRVDLSPFGRALRSTCESSKEREKREDFYSSLIPNFCLYSPRHSAREPYTSRTMSDDKSLEDFFAKKKAKKGKNKNKFTTSDVITKQVSQPKKDESKDQSSKKFAATNQAISGKEDEEWIDFQQPQEKDYSGLRIGTLQISDKQEQEANEEEEREEFNEDGELLAKKEKASPWQQATAQQTVQASKPEEKEMPNVVGNVYRPPGAYKPPGMRNKLAMSGGVKGKAPEINSEIAFPSLQAAVQDSKSKEPAGSRSFETVKHGSRSSDNPVDRRPKLDLENKYDALRRS